jgi:hypothetical protein
MSGACAHDRVPSDRENALIRSLEGLPSYVAHFSRRTSPQSPPRPAAVASVNAGPRPRSFEVTYTKLAQADVVRKVPSNEWPSDSSPVGSRQDAGLRPSARGSSDRFCPSRRRLGAGSMASSTERHTVSGACQRRLPLMKSADRATRTRPGLNSRVYDQRLVASASFSSSHLCR